MINNDKTREQLLKDLEKSNKRIAELEKFKTERKRAEEALQESEKQLQTLIDAMPDFVCFKDGDGRWLKANDACIRIFQLEGIDYRGKKDSELAELNSNLRGTFLTCEETDARARKEGGLFHEEETIPGPNGSVRVYDVTKVAVFQPSGEREGLVILGHDFSEYKRAEKALKENEEKLTTILNSMPDIVLQLDTDLKIIWANKATIKLNPKAVGQLCYKALPGRNDICPGCPIVKASKTGQIEQGVVHLKSVAGVGESYWDDIGIPIKDTQGKITSIIKLARNITENKKAEEALRESEEKYRLLANNSLDAVWQMNLKLVFTYISPSVKNIMGYTVEEWVGTRLSQHASTKEFFYMARKALFAIKNYKEFKYLIFNVVMLRKDGTEIPVEITAKLLFNKKGLPIGLQGTTRDITKRKQAEEEIKESEEQYRSLTNALPQFIYRLDKDLKYVSANKAYCKACGISYKEIKGKTSRDIFPKELADQYMAIDRKIIETEKMQVYTEKSSSISGEEKWVHVTKLPVNDNKGNVNGMIGIYWDITERKKAEEELAKHREHLEELVKERTAELEEKNKELKRYNRLFEGRELRIKELRDKIKELEEEARRSK